MKAKAMTTSEIVNLLKDSVKGFSLAINTPNKWGINQVSFAEYTTGISYLKGEKYHAIPGKNGGWSEEVFSYSKLNASDKKEVEVLIKNELNK